MLSALPADLTLYVFSFLSFKDINALYKVSRSFRKFLHDHRDALYHQLAIAHRYAVPGVSLADTVATQLEEKRGCHLKGVDTWQDFCRESVILERNWAGRGYVVQGEYTCFNDAGGVLHFAIDEQRGLLLAVTGQRAFTVRTLDGAHLVWQIPMVTQFLHSGPFLFLWRNFYARSSVEVWRFVSSSASTTAEHAPILSPSEFATTASQFAEHEALSQKPNAHGTYVPHACLPAVSRTWLTLTFHAPYFAAANFQSPNVVHIYDITCGELHQVVDLGPFLSLAADPFSVLLDLQLSEKYLCACFDTVVIFVRLRGSGERSDEAGAMQRDAVCFVDERHPFENKHHLPRAERVPEHASAISRTDDVDVPETSNVALAVSSGAAALEEYTVVTPPGERPVALPGSPRRNAPCFISAKFSPSGRHVVIGSTFSYLYFFPDIDRMFDGGLAPEEIVQKVGCGAPVKFMQWEGQDRVFAFRDEEHYTWLVDLCPTYHTHVGESESAPPLALVGARSLLVRSFGRAHVGSQGTMQMRKTGVWAIADLGAVCQGGKGTEKGAEAAAHDGLNTVCFMSFTKEGIFQ